LARSIRLFVPVTMSFMDPEMSSTSNRFVVRVMAVHVVSVAATEPGAGTARGR
jgi:hypothetical protein